MSEQKQIKVSDEAIVSWLKRARIPKRYQSMKVTLLSADKRARNFLDWRESGERKDQPFVGLVVGESADSIEGFILHARALVMKGRSVLLLSLTELADMPAWLEERVDGTNCLAIKGFVVGQFEDGLSPSNRQLVDFFLRDWLASGRSLLLEIDKPIQKCESWSKGLRSLILRDLAFITTYS